MFYLHWIKSEKNLIVILRNFFLLVNLLLIMIFRYCIYSNISYVLQFQAIAAEL